MAKLEKDWQVPPFTAPPAQRMGWIDSQVEEAESWMRGQSSYEAINDNLALMKGTPAPDPDKRSDLSTNYLEYCIRKIVASLADVRHIAIYGSDAKQFKPQCEMMNKVAKAVFQEYQFPRAVRSTMQWSTVSGMGYIWPHARREDYGFGELVIAFDSLGLCDYLPIQVPANNDVTKAYAGTIVVYMPIAEAHARFPEYQSSLKPIGRRRYNSSVASRRLDLAEMFRYGTAGQGGWDGLYCEIRFTHIYDMEINTTGQKLPMGQSNTSWFYEVPSLGDSIPDRMTTAGIKNRTATAEDCLIYPYRRLMISSFGMKEPMYDGPAFDWHGMIPVAPYCVNDWAWEGLGRSLIQGLSTVERAKRGVERGMHQVVKHRLDPSLAYDRSAGLNDTTAQSLDPFEERMRVGVDGDPEKIFRAMLPEHLLNVPEWQFKFLELLKTMEQEQLGLNDIGNLAGLKMNVQTEAAEKMLELVGPLVKDISFGMESSTAKVGQMMKYIIPQYFDTRRIMQYVGPDDMTEETFDFEPDSIVPGHMPDEEHSDQNVAILGPSIYSKVERARRFAKNLRLINVPGRLHNITQKEEQLKYLQIGRSQFPPMAPHTIAKKLNIENYGDIEGATEFDKWINWKKKELMLAKMAHDLQSALMPGGTQEPGAGPGGGQKGTGGRPPSGKAMPKVKQKGAAGGNPRTTVVESK